MKPVKPMLQLPEGCVDKTNESTGVTYAIIGPKRKDDE
jgi:hypothetical protein